MIIFHLTDSGASGVFGSEYHQSEDLSVSTKDLSSYTEKLTLTTTSLEAGKYRIGWTYSWNLDSTTYDFLARIVINNTDIDMVHQQEPKDKGGTFMSTGTNQRHKAAGFIFKDLVGINNIRLDWGRNGPNGIETSIWDARIELWRVE